MPRLAEVLDAYDHASLYANLLRVRPLFAFCVDEGGEDACGAAGDVGVPGDGLPLVVFEMARRRGAADVGDGAAGAATLLAAVDGGDATSDKRVDYDCDVASGSCRVEVSGASWKCAMYNRHACMCKKRVGEAWRFVGRTDGLLGSRPRLYHDEHKW